MTPFALSVRVYYEDTDSGGVVYYANYLKFMERARSEWLRSLGFEQDELIAREGVLFAVRSVAVDYRRPARFNDLLTVTASVVRRGGASITFLQQVVRGDELLVTGEVKIASLTVDGLRPCPLPPAIVNEIAEISL